MAAKQSGTSKLQGSPEAKRSMVAILETFAGAYGAGEAAERLKISLSRYYQLETRALQGMMTALEPKRRGPQKTPEREIKALKAEKQGLVRELNRTQSLLRAASRSVGLKPTRTRKGAPKKKGARTRRRTRGATVLKTLKETTREEPSHGTHEQHDATDRPNRSE